ncbi:MAG: lysis protein [Enterobacteriaceae bacterium]|jgi:prophage endopeptidase|nr:lysis protein [Enterobacteriaceae bacterium]
MKRLPLIITLVVGGFLGWWSHRALFLSEMANLKQRHAALIAEIHQKAHQDTLSAIQQMKDAQSRAAKLDEYYSGKLANVEEENAVLRADIAAGTRRVQIAASNLTACQRTQNRDTGTGRVGDGSQVELTAKAGRAIYDIRAGIISDQTKLDYLQQYVRDIVRQCKP